MKPCVILASLWLTFSSNSAAWADPKPIATAAPKVTTHSIPHVPGIKLPTTGSSNSHGTSGSNGWKPPSSLTGKTTGTATGTNGWKPPASLTGKASKDSGTEGTTARDKETSKDATSKDSSKDGSSKGGSSKDGKSKDGSSKDGSSKDGSSKDGNSKDGSSKDGKSKDDSSKDGTTKDAGKGTSGSDKGSAADGRIANPRQSTSWAWNNGNAWSPQSKYWGGAFWGAIPAGISVGAYFDVDAASPGHTLLENYGLKQTHCDSSGKQVELYGPDVSLICADPNGTVPAGRYDIDMSTLSLHATTAE